MTSGPGLSCPAQSCQGMRCCHPLLAPLQLQHWAGDGTATTSRAREQMSPYHPGHCDLSSYKLVLKCLGTSLRILPLAVLWCKVLVGTS